MRVKKSHKQIIKEDKDQWEDIKEFCESKFWSYNQYLEFKKKSKRV